MISAGDLVRIVKIRDQDLKDIHSRYLSLVGQTFKVLNADLIGVELEGSYQFYLEEVELVFSS